MNIPPVAPPRYHGEATGRFPRVRVPRTTFELLAELAEDDRRSLGATLAIALETYAATRRVQATRR